MGEESIKYAVELADAFTTKVAEVDRMLSKRPHDDGSLHPLKASCSMFTKLFGPRRQSVTREDFDQTWERLEQRKEHYKGRTEELTGKVKNKDGQISALERRVKELQKQLEEEQGKVEMIRGYVSDLYNNVQQNCGEPLKDMDGEAECESDNDQGVYH